MKKQRILIVGAGTAGTQLFSEIKTHPELMLEPIGFIDDDPQKNALGAIDQLQKVIHQFKIDKVLIALPSIDGSVISHILEKCLQSGIPCQTIPRVKEIIEGKVDVKRVRDVKIEDLLGRPVRKTEIKDIAGLVKNQSIMVTGAAGSIGSELCRQLALYQSKKIIMFDCWENGLYELGNEFKEFFPNTNFALVIGNIQDKIRIGSVVRLFKPTIIFHAAAYKHVPLMEENPVEAVKNNIFGTKNLIEAARKYKIKKFIFISTDKAANPKSVMGITKLIGEHLSILANKKGETQFICTRFGNVLDSFGSVLPLFKKQINHGGPITITDKKMARFFMTIPEAVQLILKAAVLGRGGEVFILDMGKPVKIIDLAKKFILLSGLLPEKDIKIEFIGKRPGEKITERLVASNEKLLTTKNPEICLIERQPSSPKKTTSLLEELELYCENDDQKKVIEKLRTLRV